MNELELLEQVVDELDTAHQEESNDLNEFRERYDLLVDCAIDELNDEVFKCKLNDSDKYRFILVQEGKHEVYVGEQLSARNFIGGEEFSLVRVERGSSKSSLVNFVFAPNDVVQYSYLVLPYNQALSYMTKHFGETVAYHLLPAMNSIEKDVIDLQREFEDRHRQRLAKLVGDADTYQESSWV